MVSHYADSSVLGCPYELIGTHRFTALPAALSAPIIVRAARNYTNITSTLRIEGIEVNTVGDVAGASSPRELLPSCICLAMRRIITATRVTATEKDEAAGEDMGSPLSEIIDVLNVCFGIQFNEQDRLDLPAGQGEGASG